MDISVFFQAVPHELYLRQGTISESCHFHTNADFPELDEVQFAIIGVRAGSDSPGNESCSDAPDSFREKFYRLAKVNASLSFADLGNIEEGDSQSDTEFAIRETCAFLMKRGIIPLVIGGSQNFTYPAYTAFEQLEHTVNLVTVDHRLDISSADEIKSSRNYLSHIILHKPNILFNYSNIGQQRSMVSQDLLDLMEKMYFDTYRLGEVSSNIIEIEPVVRNADILSFDMGVIRAADAIGNANVTPNGLYAEEACQIARFAGMSDRLGSIGFYEFNPELDQRGHTAQLLAEMVWYFAEGVSLRKGEYPVSELGEYFRYIIELEQHQLVFYKSNKSDRWWMDVPYPAGTKNKYERHHIIPCTYSDYQTATNEEVPDRWWKTYQKLV